MRAGVVALAVLGAVILAIYLLIRFSEPPVIVKPECEPADIVQIENGFSKEQRRDFYHASFGSEMLPPDYLQALENPNTGNLLLSELDRFGLLCDPNDLDGLPIGFSTAPSSVLPSKRKMAGMNCSICHVAELRYKGKHVRIDGAPSQFNTTRFVTEFGQSLEALKDPRNLYRFLRRLHAIRAQRDNSDMTESKMEFEDLRKKYADAVEFIKALGDELGEVPESVAKTSRAVRLFKARRDYFAQMKLLKQQFGGTPAGPGRADTWVTGRNSVFPEHATAWTSPSSYPHLWGYDSSKWLTWNGTTQSGADRDVATALGMMTFFDLQSHESSLLPQALLDTDGLLEELSSPKWPPGVFGNIHQAKFKRGARLYQTHCARCHQTRTLTPIDEVGTDRQHWENYHKPVGDQPFHEAFPAEIRKFKQRAYEEQDVPQSEIDRFEKDRPNVWRASEAYAARPLNGIWATAPYLHNGSVPTLYDLLLPASERPATFTLGSRDYDPKKLGFESDLTNESLFLFDTSLKGNSNAGHQYGVNLNESERYDLLEYLKGI